MLYLSFRFTLLMTSLMGIIHMLATEEFTYIFFPIVMFIWAIYTFFEEDDKEYRRRNGDYYHLGSDSWLDPDGSNAHYSWYDNEYYNYGGSRTYKPFKVDRTKEYKNVVKKCKRNFKITIDK